jgi:hypothetical protein
MRKFLAFVLALTMAFGCTAAASAMSGLSPQLQILGHLILLPKSLEKEALKTHPELEEEIAKAVEEANAAFEVIFAHIAYGANKIASEVDVTWSQMAKILGYSESEAKVSLETRTAYADFERTMLWLFEQAGPVFEPMERAFKMWFSLMKMWIADDELILTEEAHGEAEAAKAAFYAELDALRAEALKLDDAARHALEADADRVAACFDDLAAVIMREKTVFSREEARLAAQKQIAFEEAFNGFETALEGAKEESAAAILSIGQGMVLCMADFVTVALSDIKCD